MCDRFRIVKEYKETLQVIQDSRSKVIIAGSGMVGGGRVLSYLQKYLSIPETTVLLAGYQAEGTRGRALLRGASELKIYGQYIPVRAEVLELQALSAHGDQLELLDWLSELEQRPERVFIVHGEPHASDALRVKIKDTYGWTCEMPELYEVVDMERT